MPGLADLQTAVAAEDTEIGSAITLLNGIPALIAAAGTDPVALAALVSDIQNQTQALAAAVVANTPSAPGGGTPITGTGVGTSTSTSTVAGTATGT